MSERTSLISAIKELIAIYPKSAEYIFIISIAIVGRKFVVEVGTFIINKFFPDLPYKHSTQIKKNTKIIEEHTKAINKLSSTINKIDGKLESLLTKKGGKGKK